MSLLDWRDTSFNDGKLTFDNNGNDLTLGPSTTSVPILKLYVRDISFVVFWIPAVILEEGTGSLICLDPDRIYPIRLYSLRRWVSMPW